MKKEKCAFGCNIVASDRASIVANYEAAPKKDIVNVTLDSDKWLLTQATALSSVNTYDKFKITANTAEFVNNNGHAWPTEILRKHYKSLIGAHNYKNHVQDPNKSYGIILDAVPRKIHLDGDETVMYVDILIATNREKNPEWVKAIESGKIKFGSVGCSSSALQCTQCGNIAPSPSRFCNHIKFENGMYFIDANTGSRLRTANLVTDYKNDEGRGFLNFTEYSYLDNNPAFAGSSVGHVIAVPPHTKVTFPVNAKIQDREAYKIWFPEFEK